MARILVSGDAGDMLDVLTGQSHEVLPGPATPRVTALLRDLHPDLVILFPEPGLGGLKLVRLLCSGGELGPPLLVVLNAEPWDPAPWLREGAWQVMARSGGGEELSVRAEALLVRKLAIERILGDAQRATLLELAGAVAHRVNQPLTSMSVIVETLIAAQSRGDLSPERLLGRLAELQRMVERMALIVRQIAEIEEYRTTPYVGAVRIIDLDWES